MMRLLSAAILCSSLAVATLVTAGPPPSSHPPLRVLPCRTVWDVPGEGDDYFLGGLLVDAGWDHDGNLCVVDYANRDLKVFRARDGEYLRTLGREGEGPGECTDARLLVVRDDGRLGLLQKFPAKLVWLMPDGDPGGQTVLENTLTDNGYLSMPHAVQHPGGLMGYLAVMALTRNGPQEDHWLAPVKPDGRVGKPLWHHQEIQPSRRGDEKYHEDDLYYVWAARWAPDGRGGAWLAPERDQYLISHRADDGTQLGYLRRAYEPVPRDELARHQAEERLVRRGRRRHELVISDTDPVVHRLRLAGNGDLWVDLSLGGRGPQPGTIAHIDVWSAGGQWMSQWRLVGDYDPNLDQRLIVDDRHVLVLRASADGDVRLRLLEIPDAKLTDKETDS